MQNFSVFIFYKDIDSICDIQAFPWSSLYFLVVRLHVFIVYTYIDTFVYSVNNVDLTTYTYKFNSPAGKNFLAILENPVNSATVSVKCKFLPNCQRVTFIGT